MCLERQFWWRWPAVSLPRDFVSAYQVDKRCDIKRGVASREAADSRRQQKNRQGREELLCMEQGGRASGRPGMFWLD